MKYPALYYSASDGSAKSQGRFFAALRSEYILLVIVAALSAGWRHLLLGKVFILLILMVLAGILVLKMIGKAEQDWYRYRALAESIKTSAWRFSMAAEPFDDRAEMDAVRDLQAYLGRILEINRASSSMLSANVDEEQVTNEMMKLRRSDCATRLSHYRSNRISEQRAWYRRKAKYNKRAYF